MVTTNDCKFLFTGSSDGTFKQFRIDTHQMVHHYKDFDQTWITSLAITNDDRYLFTGGYTSVKQFRIDTCEEVHKYKGIFDDWVDDITLA